MMSTAHPPCSEALTRAGLTLNIPTGISTSREMLARDNKVSLTPPSRARPSTSKCVSAEAFAALLSTRQPTTVTLDYRHIDAFKRCHVKDALHATLTRMHINRLQQGISALFSCILRLFLGRFNPLQCISSPTPVAQGNSFDTSDTESSVASSGKHFEHFYTS